MKLTRHSVAAASAAAAAAVALAAGPAQLAGAAVAARSGTAHAAPRLPYTDPDQSGWLTLCGTNLKPVTSGSVDAKPFVWRVVSSLPAPKGYFVKGAKATMFAYQPRPYTPAGAWSGMVMAAASLYSNPRHPMAQFTPIDEPLKDMVESFPPIWDHLIELRLYLSAPGLTPYTRPYAAADIRVTGNTWTLVAGGRGSCTKGKVESIETAVGLPGASGTPTPAPSRGARPSSSSAHPGSGGSAASGSPAPTVTIAPAAASAGSSPGGVAIAVTAGLVVLAFALGASGGMWWRRRRRATG